PAAPPIERERVSREHPHHAPGEEHVGHEKPPRDPCKRREGEHQRREQRRAGAEERPSERPGPRKEEEGEEHGAQPSAPLARAEDGERGCRAPVGERWLLVVLQRVEMRGDPVPAHEHLATDLRVARLVRLPEAARTETPAVEQSERRYQRETRDLWG